MTPLLNNPEWDRPPCKDKPPVVVRSMYWQIAVLLGKVIVEITPFVTGLVIQLAMWYYAIRWMWSWEF